MSVSTVISDVTETLQELLRNEQRPLNSFDISLESPADETIVPSMRPKVNLFLFRVAENPFAKNRQWQSVGADILQYPPLALNLFYVVTPFAEDKLDEHRVLGEAMRIFYDNAIVEPPLLMGSLEFSNEELKIDLCQFSIEEHTRIWNAFNKPYRLSVCYEIRIIMIDSQIEKPSQRVTEKVNQYTDLITQTRG